MIQPGTRGLDTLFRGSQVEDREERDFNAELEDLTLKGFKHIMKAKGSAFNYISNSTDRRNLYWIDIGAWAELQGEDNEREVRYTMYADERLDFNKDIVLDAPSVDPQVDDYKPEIKTAKVNTLDDVLDKTNKQLSTDSDNDLWSSDDDGWEE